MSKRIYLAGPMRGISRYNFPSFFAAEARLQEQGYVVVNPARLDIESGFDPFALPANRDWSSLPEGVAFKDLMARDLPALLSCDAIYLMDGWEDSRGAEIEFMVATRCDLEVIHAPSRVVGFCGYARVGKDTAGSRTGFACVHYADQLKDDLSVALCGLAKEVARPLMVAYGAARRATDPDYWVKELRLGEGNAAVCDVRYANEVQHILGLGGVVIRVHRPGYGPANDEEARSIAEIEARYPAMPKVVNDGTLEELGRKVMAIIEQHYAEQSPPVASASPR